MCCGCGACKQVCPKGCIDILKNRKGFFSAKLSNELCINCGLCTSVCPISNSIFNKNQDVPLYYIAVAKQESIYERASSGGIFPIVAKKILELGGSVWGCGYGKELSVIHKKIKSFNELDDICRSKYVQSYLGDAYSVIKEDLTKGELVLFSGTPCQIAGLKNFLKKDYKNLFLIDIICHGVPSAGLFQEHKKYIENKYHKKLIRYEFRLKEKHKDDIYYYNYYFDDGTFKSGAYYKDIYYNSFYNVLSLNDICYQCPYACEKRVGDITIGDYGWGKKYHKSFEMYNDISCISVNNEKGRKLFSYIQDELKFENTNFEWIVERNTNLIKPTEKATLSDTFYEDIYKLGYKKWARKYYMSVDYIKKSRVITILKKWMKR
ncbi:putative uncharacterized protein [Roseburia sp. CAG:303]|nr:putative uncharacterized protein [Roseburia sp. CAG:303]